MKRDLYRFAKARRNKTMNFTNQTRVKLDNIIKN